MSCPHSDRHPGRSIADVATDTAAVADALGIDRFRTWGAHGECFGNRLSDATAWVSPDYGHMSLMTRISDVHAWLLSHES